MPLTASPSPATGGGGSADPWGIASSAGYDPDTIYVRASDDHGHSSDLRAKVSPTMLYEMRALIEGREIPELRSYADIIRDALIHRMKRHRDWLKENGLPTGSMDASLETEMREAELDRIKSQQDHWDSLIDKLDKQLTKCSDRKDWDTMRHLLERNEEPQDMTDPFVRLLNSVLNKHWKHLEENAVQLPGMTSREYDYVRPPRRVR